MTSTAGTSAPAVLLEGVLRGRRAAATLRPGDLITGDELALAGDRQYAHRVLRGPWRAWVSVEPVMRDLDFGPYRWRVVGPERAERIPASGVFVLPAQETSSEDPGAIG